MRWNGVESDAETEKARQGKCLWAHNQLMPDRLQKVLAQRGVASRRASENLIAEGRVTVNGQRARLGQTVEPSDIISVDGDVVQAAEERIYLALNKPIDYVTSLRSTHGEKTVAELIPDTERIFPVGRLDKDTSGLLLLTNDGAWADLVTHPRYRVQKEYRVVVRGIPAEEVLQRLRAGVQLRAGTTTSPARIQVISTRHGNADLSVTVIEGRKRQIREMFAAIGHAVIKLRRVRIGNIGVEPLAEGRWRKLRAEEIEGIREHARSAAGSGAQTEAAGGD